MYQHKGDLEDIVAEEEEFSQGSFNGSIKANKNKENGMEIVNLCVYVYEW